MSPAHHMPRCGSLLRSAVQSNGSPVRSAGARLSPLLLLLVLGCEPDPKGGGSIDADVDGVVVDDDGDGIPQGEDCDDTDAAVGPGAVELCNGLDDNCDGVVDEGVTEAFFADADGDGFGDEGQVADACAPPTGFVGAAGDCDDTDDSVFPGAVEVCNGADDDCNGDIDEGVTLDLWQDSDGDGFGDPEAGFVACEVTEGAVDNALDCNDNNDAVHPDAVEVCNEEDDNCNGDVDEGVTVTFYADTDGDGWGDAGRPTEACSLPEGYSNQPGDCDDGVETVHPDAAEYCNGADDNCDGAVDEDTALDVATWYADTDTDGYGDATAPMLGCVAPVGHVAAPTDCDDTATAVNPGASEVCNGIDDDCDAAVDDADSSVDLSTGSAWYADTDGDGFGDGASATTACDAPTQHVSDATDCDDGEGAINPLATEVCNGVDDNCDGTTDDDDPALDASTATTWYTDVDGDGYGVSTASSVACVAPTGAVALDGDCDDGDTDYHPGAALGCDGEDYDCDGQVDGDADLDGFADATCGGDDCDDDDSAIKPDSTGDCALGLTCADILDEGRSTGDGDYFIDPDGFGTGLDPFEVPCDMSTDSGGWTEIAYASDVAFQNWFTHGDRYEYLATDFAFVLSDAQIAAIQALSVEGYQEYVGRCEHVIHYYYNAGASYAYAFGFEFFDGTQTPYASSSYAPYNITVTADGCAGNGGEGGSLSLTTDFAIDSVLVPIRNVQCRDCGDGGEYFGSVLTDNPAWLR